MEHSLETFLKFFEKLGAFPYKIKLVPGTLNYSILPRAYCQQKAWILYLICSCLHFSHIFNSTLQYKSLLQKGDYMRVVFHAIVLLGIAYVILQTLPLSLGRIETSELCNGAVVFMQKLEKGGIFMTIKLVYLKNYIVTLCGILLSAFSITILIALTIMAGSVYESSSRFVCHLKNRNCHGKYAKRVVRTVKAVADLHTSSFNFFRFHLEELGPASYATELFSKAGKRKSYKADQNELQQKLSIYQQLTVLYTLYNDSFGTHYIPFISSATGTGVVQGIFMTIKMAYLANVFITGLGILCFTVCGSVLMLVTTLTAGIHEQSSQFLCHIKAHGYRGKCARRIVRAIHVVTVRSGSLYDIKRITTLTVLGMLANVSGSALLSFHF
ncbi:unnamed protein product [Orchesella dallaii]|uniref:Odorant receptor n=1 Tax=Orchesella dallaii TaxID=48710 RepID=A0ABP1S7E2_9HEXA